jgi:hypothetical protein
LKEFEVTIPQEYMNYVKREIRKPKRQNTELLELWLERELDLENPGSYGNLPTDASHVTAQILPDGNFKIAMSDVCFAMIKSHLQPEPHSRRKLADEDIFRCWLEIKIEEDKTEQRIKVKELV